MRQCKRFWIKSLIVTNLRVFICVKMKKKYWTMPIDPYDSQFYRQFKRCRKKCHGKFYYIKKRSFSVFWMLNDFIWSLSFSSLLQAFLEGMNFDSALLLDLRRIVQISERMVGGLIDFFQTNQFTNNCYKSILSSTILIKSLRTRTWSDCNVFGELNISKADANKLINSGINTIDALTKIKPREIEDVSPIVFFF